MPMEFSAFQGFEVIQNHFIKAVCFKGIKPEHQCKIISVIKQCRSTISLPLQIGDEGQLKLKHDEVLYQTSKQFVEL